MTPPPPTSINKNRKPGLTAKGDQRQYVKHSYKDRSNETVGDLTTSDENTLRLYQEDSVGGPFPLKLQIVLKVTEKLGQQHIISWLPHGRSFMIHRPREFETEIMGKFFKQTKLTSFRRQLNLYDFQRITHGRDAGSYYHELFLRGRPLLAKRMIRRKVKGTKIRASSSPDDEPNFYKMVSMEALSDVPGRHAGMVGGMVGHGGDPSFVNGHDANGSSFTGTMPGSSANGMMNGHHGDPSALFQQQAALASFHSTPVAAYGQQYGQNHLYSDLMHMNRMQQHLAPHLYGGAAGGMNNLDYISALQQRNALASSALGFHNGYNPYLQGDPSLFGLQGAAGVDPRLSPYNKALLGGMQGDVNVGAPYTNLTAGNPNSMSMNQGPTAPGTGTTTSRILMEQMNLGNQQAPIPAKNDSNQPNEENKQNAVEQLLRLQKDQTVSSPSVADSKAKEVRKEIETPEGGEGLKELVAGKSMKKDEVAKTEVLAL